jgi:hypothetical protein
MNKDFTQSYISPALIDFKKGFNSKWKLDDYSDTNTPTIFLGMYGQKDAESFINHKGPKVMVFAGNDMHPPQLNLVAQHITNPETFAIAPPGEFSDTLTTFNIPHKKKYWAVKSYDNLTPTMLGENIYIYLGRPDNRRLEYFKYNEVVKPLVHVFGNDRVHWVTEEKTLPFNELKNKYYENSFCYVRPSARGGATAMHELAHMGRRTIGLGFPELEYSTEFTSIENLIELIVKESEYIGKIRPDVADSVKNLFVGEEWLTLQYYRT